MKKTYIKPETIAVVLNVRDNVLQVTSPTVNVGVSQQNYNPETSGDIQSRDVINTPDAWEEW